MSIKTDILYTSDNRYLDIMLASIMSLVSNSNLKNIRIHIITENFCIEDYKKVEKLLCNYENVDFYFYPLEEISINKYQIPNWRGCQIANSRLFFQEILYSRISDIKNLLYLDSDTIIISDLNNIKDYNSNTICACKDRVIKRYPQKLNLNDYYNSGILYFNVEEWIKNSCEEKIIKHLEESKIKYNFPDQDILNLTFNDDITTLPLKYNVNPDIFIYKGIAGKIYFNEKERTISYEEATEARKDPKILHSYALAEIKPWYTNNVNPFNDIFRHYINEINPSFELEDLKNLKKIMNQYPRLFYLYLYMKPHIPKKIKNETVKTIMKLKNNSSRF